MRIDGNDIAEARDETLDAWDRSGDPDVPRYVIEEALNLFIENLTEKGI